MPEQKGCLWIHAIRESWIRRMWKAANESIVETGAVAFRSAGKLVQLKENSFGLENTLELSKTLFGDLKKRDRSNDYISSRRN